MTRGNLNRWRRRRQARALAQAEIPLDVLGPLRTEVLTTLAAALPDVYAEVAPAYELMAAVQARARARPGAPLTPEDRQLVAEALRAMSKAEAALTSHLEGGT